MMKQMFSKVKPADFFDVWKSETQRKDLQCTLILLLDRDSKKKKTFKFADKVDWSHLYSVRWLIRGTTNEFSLLLMLLFHTVWKIFFDKSLLSLYCFLKIFAPVNSFSKGYAMWGKTRNSWNLTIGKYYCYYYCSVLVVDNTERLFWSRINIVNYKRYSDLQRSLAFFWIKIYSQ